MDISVRTGVKEPLFDPSVRTQTLRKRGRKATGPCVCVCVCVGNREKEKGGEDKIEVIVGVVPGQPASRRTEGTSVSIHTHTTTHCANTETHTCTV